METNDKSTRKTGDEGEQEAVEYLESKGYAIVKRNFHFGKAAELDIIALDGNVLVFVEVKTRLNDKYGDPLFSITPHKQNKMRLAARGYLYINKIVDRECRFDVVVVNKMEKTTKFEHLVNAM